MAVNVDIENAYFAGLLMKQLIGPTSLIIPLILMISCTDNAVMDGLRAGAPESFLAVIDSAEHYELQILYVQIDRDRDNRPDFVTHYFNADPSRYFYPASTVKMPVAFLALDKINQLNRPGLTAQSRMHTDSARYPQSVALLDSTSTTGVPSIDHYISRAFVVSDNDAYNRLYEFVGLDGINDRLDSLGINDTRIIHRLSDLRFGPEENRYTNPVSFYSNDTIVYGQAEVRAERTQYVQPRDQVKGVAFVDRNGKLVNEPFDFSQKNFFPLQDQVEVLKRVIFPESYSESERFNLTESDYAFLRTEMSRLPSESNFPKYSDPEYVDGYVKFFIYGDRQEPIPENIRIFNKVGWAYGYLTDCAYIVDIENNIEFILAATIHANANQTYNDGIYEGDEVAIPFLAELGRRVYQYELERPRKVEPDLSSFKLTYEDDGR